MTELHLYAMYEVERVLVKGANRVVSVCGKRFSGSQEAELVEVLHILN